MKKVFLIILTAICSVWAWADDGTNDVANIVGASPVNLGIIGVFALVCLGIIYLIVRQVLNYFREHPIKKIGPVEMMEQQKAENTDHNKAISCLHYMDEEISDVDSDLRVECFQIVHEFTPHMLAHLRSMAKDKMLVGNIMANMKVILLGSVVRNHFTKQLMPDTIDRYKRRYMGLIEDFYRNMCTDMNSVDLVPWDSAKKSFTALLDDWIGRVKIAVSEACGDKVTIYERYLKRFKEDSEWYGVADERRMRNMDYINKLKV